MSVKKERTRLSQAVLEMKFMKRTKDKVDKEIEEAEGRALYSSEISNKMIHGNLNYIVEPSFVICENLVEGRLSFRGMNPEIERLLELEQAERADAKRIDQPKEVSDKEMAAFYHAKRAPAATQTMARKFQIKQEQFKRKLDEGPNTINSKKKRVAPLDRDDSD